MSTKWTQQELAKLWKMYDANGNGSVSLGEIDAVVTKLFPDYNHSHYKPALVWAYKMADSDHSGLITRSEFNLLLRCLATFQHLWKRFDELDKDSDHVLSLSEFLHGREALGLGNLDERRATALFNKIDVDKSGRLRFYELATHCAWFMAEEDGEEDEAEKGAMAKQFEVGADGELVAPTTFIMSRAMAAKKAADERALNGGGYEESGSRKKKQGNNHMSHDGLLVTAPKGTKFEAEWVRITEELADLEFQSLQGIKGERQSTFGGRGGRVEADGYRTVNRRK